MKTNIKVLDVELECRRMCAYSRRGRYWGSDYQPVYRVEYTYTQVHPVRGPEECTDTTYVRADGKRAARAKVLSFH